MRYFGRSPELLTSLSSMIWGFTENFHRYSTSQVELLCPLANHSYIHRPEVCNRFMLNKACMRFHRSRRIVQPEHCYCPIIYMAPFHLTFLDPVYYEVIVQMACHKWSMMLDAECHDDLHVSMFVILFHRSLACVICLCNIYIHITIFLPIFDNIGSLEVMIFSYLQILKLLCHLVKKKIGVRFIRSHSLE